MRIHIHANCQAVPLAGMLKEVYPDWDVSYFEVHAQPILENLAHYHECMRTADVVLAQPIHAGFRDREDLTLDWIRANVRPGASLIVFPSMHFAAHQSTWEINPFPGFDLLAAHLVASGLQPEDAIQHLLSPDLLADSDIEREIAASIAETTRRERDDAIDVKISPFLEEHGYEKLLFHLNNHPLRETAVFMTNTILQQMALPRRVTVKGYDYQASAHMPPLPAVTRFLSSRSGMKPDPTLYESVRLHGISDMSIVSYYEQMLQRLAAIPAADLFSSIEKRWPAVQVLRRLAVHNNKIPGIARWAS